MDNQTPPKNRNLKEVKETNLLLDFKTSKTNANAEARTAKCKDLSPLNMGLERKISFYKDQLSTTPITSKY